MGILPKHIIKSEKAQTTAEFVVVIPFLLLLFFLMVDFGWMLKNYLVVTNTGREVARCSVVSRCTIDGNEVGPEAFATNRLRRGLGSNLDTTFSIHYLDQDGSTEINKGDSVVVCLEADNDYISPVLPFLSMVSGGSLPNPMPLRARTEMRVELVAGDYADLNNGSGSCGFSP